MPVAEKTRERLPDRKSVLVRVPGVLKQKLIEAAAGSNLNDVIVEALADHYSMPDETTGREARREIGDSDNVIVRMSPKLKRRVQREAFYSELNMSDVILNILAARYNVELSPPVNHRVPWGGGRQKKKK